MPLKKRNPVSRKLLEGLSKNPLFPMRAPEGKKTAGRFIGTSTLANGLQVGIVGGKSGQCFEIVAGKEWQVLGWAKANYVESQKSYHIASLMVHPDARRWGVGEAMMRYAIQAASKIRASKVVARVEADNTAMIALLRKLGFHKTFVRAIMKDESDHYIFKLPV